MRIARIGLVMLALVLAAACAQSEAPPTPQPDLEATVQAMVKAVLPTETPTSAPDIAAIVAAGVAATMEALPTHTPVSTNTPPPTATRTVTPTPAPTSAPTQTPVPTVDPTPAATHTPLPTSTPTLAQTIERIERSLVYIKTPSGSGSGFIVEEDGLVVTNAHVVENFETVSVVTADGIEYAGDVLGVDEIADLALVEVRAGRRFAAMGLGDSDSVQVGDDVIALGFPLRYELGSSLTVTRGIISSKRVSYGVEELQTDAAINPGNSGGPLVDRDGRVIGVNYAELSLSDGSPVDNIGFSIAVNELKKRMDALAKGDDVLLPTPTPGQWTAYRNQEYGYGIDIPPGWRLTEETDAGDASFSADGRAAILEVYLYDLSDVDYSLTEFAEWVRDDLAELARSQTWDVFEISDFAGVRRDSGEYYWLEYKYQDSAEYCVSRNTELIVLSSQYPAVPYGFSVSGVVCEHSLDYYADQVSEMIASFADWTPPAFSATPTPAAWTTYYSDGYGYEIDIPTEWSLSDETDEDYALFVSEDDEATLQIYVFDLSDDYYSIAEFAEWVRDDLVELARINAWDVFEITDFALARASAVTSDLKLGTGITLITERNPLVLAKTIAALDFYSGGRFLFGIGTGWHREETEMMGGDFDHRWTQAREATLALKELWTQDEAEFHGKYYDFPPVKCYPKPAQDPHPPVLLGGMAKNVLRRVARWGDGWLPNRVTPPQIAESRAILDTLAAEYEREPSSLTINVHGQPPERDLVNAYLDAGADRVIVRTELCHSEEEMNAELERVAEAVL